MGYDGFIVSSWSSRWEKLLQRNERLKRRAFVFVLSSIICYFVLLRVGDLLDRLPMTFFSRSLLTGYAISVHFLIKCFLQVLVEISALKFKRLNCVNVKIKGKTIVYWSKMNYEI